MNPGEAGKMDSEYKSFLAELGGGLPPTDSGAQRGSSCYSMNVYLTSSSTAQQQHTTFDELNLHFHPFV
jgi:hypothetical protein